MRLVNIKYGMNIEFDENEILEIVIEQPRAFSEIVYMLINQCNGADEDFILSEDEQIIKLNKYADIIMDFFAVSPNNKKIITKLYSGLEEIAQNYIEEKTDINSKIVSVLDAITTSEGCAEISYNLDYNWTDLFKLYNISFSDDYLSLIDKITSYIKIVSQFTDIKILFFINARSYLTKDEMNVLYETARYCKINIALIESHEFVERNDEKRYIIDKDLCFIDAN